MINIYNEDCISGAKKYFEDNSVDLIVTDPPFNLGFGGTTQTKSKKPRFDIIANDNLSFKDYQRFSIKWLKEAYRVLKPKRHIYVCIDWRMYSYVHLWMKHVGFNIKNLIVWDKVNFGLGYQYRFQHELIIFAVKSDKNVRRVSKRNISDVWKVKKISGNLTCHPTEKPRELFDLMIENSSEEKEIVVDFFCGSGPSVLSAIKLNRNFTGFEIDDTYYNLIKSRIAHV